MEFSKYLYSLKKMECQLKSIDIYKKKQFDILVICKDKFEYVSGQVHPIERTKLLITAVNQFKDIEAVTPIYERRIVMLALIG